MPLPIDASLPAVRAALAGRGAAVLVAEPGAGKTTRVPLALLDEPWLRGQRIVMLEPRRLAARGAARFMAHSLGESVGGTVGYRVRRDSRVGPRTRLEVVTEGVLTRQLQHDPTLDGVGLVIFDEFHERSLQGDLGLALTLHARQLVRDDLRVLVMSATLDAGPVAELLSTDGPMGDGAAGISPVPHRPAPVIASPGRVFPVETRYAPRAADVPVPVHTARIVRAALAEHEGDALVFLPGAGVIARTADLLEDGPLPARTVVHRLHGSLPAEAQDAAVAPSVPGARKIVLATTIAQTSLTIEGVRIVVDAGFTRTPRFSPRTGMTRLETVRVTRAAADQRRGRAGRTAPGTCYRLWSEYEDTALAPFDRPEILDADLAPLALELAAAGVDDPLTLPWLDAPPAHGLAQARALLAELDALDGAGRVTRHGRAMALLSAHPRVAHMLVRSRELGAGAAAVACDLAAILGQRDLLRFDRGDLVDADVGQRLAVLRDLAATGRASTHAHAAQVDRGAAYQALAESREWRRALGVARDAAYDVSAAGALVALAYPDRLAQRRGAGAAPRFLLRNGTGAVLAQPGALGDAEYLAVADTGGASVPGASLADARIALAAALGRDEIETLFGDRIARENSVEWDAGERVVRARTRVRLDALVLSEGPLARPDAALVQAAWAGAVRREGLALLPWSDGAVRLRERLAFAHHADPLQWPDVSDRALLGTLDGWLLTRLPTSPGRDALARVDVHDALQGMLAWDERQRLDRFAPTHRAVPSGSQIRIDYADPAAPVLAARLQELFGLDDTPRVADGRVPLTVHILSPAHRPVQITRDLAGFWRTSYHDVRKDMKGRYPKHDWPEDPTAAVAHRGRKPRAES